MSDEIEMGTKVWGRDNDKHEWKGPYRYINDSPISSYSHSFLRGDGNIDSNKYITTTDPAAPIRPDCLKDNEELWHWDAEGIYYEDSEGDTFSHSKLMDDYLPRLVGFAVKDGSEITSIQNSLRWFTGDGAGLSCVMCGIYSDVAEVIGAVMLKGDV